MRFRHKVDGGTANLYPRFFLSVKVEFALASMRSFLWFADAWTFVPSSVLKSKYPLDLRAKTKQSVPSNLTSSNSLNPKTSLGA